MFYYLKGALVHLENGLAVLDVGGVGYKLTVSGTTYDAMPPNRSVATPPTVCLYTHMAVREDDVELFGFATQEELASFKLLISVSGIGPKAAMSILTLLSPEKFALAVCTEDKKTIAKANGIGPKTAARVILELKDKLMKETDLSSPIAASPAASTAGAARGKLSEAVDALVVLGYSRAEASGILKDLDPSLELEDLIRAALKKLMKF
ncbi:MAG: Holliday junction branch migration protein RuvA [Clostridia bacterium]|nr:Holliday junction branch migration protein RuvA [Clostridia bacterium]MBQ5662160.1 Holliday junction branch migration protein RuvA [Clostridia bacterium]